MAFATPAVSSDAAVMGVCQSCRAQAPTCPVTFRQNIGAIVMRFQRNVKGELCTDCVDRYFWKMTGTTLAVGWLGVVSIIVWPFFIGLNIRDFLSARRKFRLAGVGRDSRLGLATLLLGLLSLFVCSPLVIPALLAIVLGLVTIVRARRDPEAYSGTMPALVGIGAGGASLMVMMALTAVFLLNESERKDPAVAALSDANWKVDQASGEQALGNTEAARDMSAKVNAACKGLDQPDPRAPADSPCVTYAEASADKVCFLVHVPHFRAFSKEQAQSATVRVWQAGRDAAKKAYNRTGVKVGVGLRGSMLYGGVATGVVGVDEAIAVDTAGVALPPQLREFFAPPVPKAVSARPLPR